MTTRRDFIRGAGAMAGGLAAGMAFCSCAMLDTARAQQPAAPARLPVTVAGKRVKTIDVHSHCLFHEAVGLLGAEGGGVVQRVLGFEKQYIVVEERLKAMDAQAIDMEVLSINPFWYRRERDLAARIVQVNIEKLAELCASKPDRFAAFASLALQFPDLAVQQLEDAMKKYGLRGAAIGGSVAGEDFSDPKFHPVWAKAEELGAVLFIHPQSTPELAKRFKGNGWLANTIGNPLDTTIALQHLIFEGTLDRFPGLKVLAAHGGGFFPSYAPRSDRACSVSPAQCDPNIKLKKKPTEYLRQIYVDALIFTPEALRHVVAEMGASQIMLGSDYPFPWEEHPVDHIFATTTLSDDEKIAILGGNAARLFGVKNLTAREETSMADEPRLKIAIGPYGHTKALKDGSVPIRGVAPEYIEVVPIVGAFRRMVRDLEFDVCEMAPTTYMIARARGAPYIALPVFLMRRFHHGGFVVRPDAGIKVPKDLEGRKVGVRAYSVTTGVYTRGIFVNEYGLDSAKVTWVVDDEEHVATLQLPPNVVHAPPGKSLVSMMESGEIQAGFTGPAGVGRAGPPVGAWEQRAHTPPGTYPELIPDVAQVEANWFARTGIYPVHALVTVKTEILEKHPGVARALYDAFVAAKQPYVERLARGEGDTADDQRYRALSAVVGDPLPYGIAANRPSIEALVTYALQQGLIPSRPTLEEIFVDPTS